MIYLLHYFLDFLLHTLHNIKSHCTMRSDGKTQPLLVVHYNIQPLSNIHYALRFLGLEAVVLPLNAMVDKGKVGKTGQGVGW